MDELVHDRPADPRGIDQHWANQDMIAAVVGRFTREATPQLVDRRRISDRDVYFFGQRISQPREIWAEKRDEFVQPCLARVLEDDRGFFGRQITPHYAA